jgi:hypothetical protein
VPDQLPKSKGAAATVTATALKSRLNGSFEKDNNQRGDAAIRALMAAVGENAAKFEVQKITGSKPIAFCPQTAGATTSYGR